MTKAATPPPSAQIAPPIPPQGLDQTRSRLQALNMHGLVQHLPALLHEPWLPRILDIEESERKARSLDRRIANARLGQFKPIADFDWQWPSKCDRALIEELCTLQFLEEPANVVLVGPNGIGKSMIAQNLVHLAVMAGHRARFVMASDMLHDLAGQPTSTDLARRVRRYSAIPLLAIDEIGYLSYDARYADLLFEVISRRYQRRATIVTTNKPFGEWATVFPNASCVVTLVDRLVHRAEIVSLEGRSYRLREAEQRAATKKASRNNATRRKST